jgi:Tetratricopeptide repeat/Cytochrome c554 and c-prime
MMLLLAALYVGNSACKPCHAEIVRSYEATPMARSSGKVNEGVPPGSFRHAPSNTEYDIGSSGKVQVSRGARRSERDLEYFIGSGAAGRSFLYSDGGFLFQAPITWYARDGRWDVSPGYESDTVSRWSRAVTPDCLNCHSSQIRASPDFENRYANPPFAQPGIGCERCHGAGSEHIVGRSRMVNPAKLDPARRDSVCAQCHMSGEARIAKLGKQMNEYRPGALLSDYVSYFVFGRASAVKAASYVERLGASRCKTMSGDRLWCGTCHDPHRVPAAATRAAWYREKCLACHEQSDCRQGAGDCAGCHMPRTKVVDGGHGVLTDHAIPAVAAISDAVANGWKLEGFSAADAGGRELGLAYVEVSARTGDAKQSAEGIRLLSGVAGDAEVNVRLADLYLARGDFARALPLYQSALRKRPSSIPALVNLGKLYGMAGKLEEAKTLWREALKRNPCQLEASENLRLAIESGGGHAESEPALARRAFCVVE